MLHYTDDQQQMLPEVIRKFLYEFTDVDYPSVVVLLLYFINLKKKKVGSRLQQTKIQTVSYLKNLRKAVAVFCFHIVRLIICCFWSRVFLVSPCCCCSSVLHLLILHFLQGVTSIAHHIAFVFDT